MPAPVRIRKSMPVRGLRPSWPSDSLGDAHSPAGINVRFKFGKVQEGPGRDLFGGSATSEDVLNIGTLFKVDGTRVPFKITNSGLYKWDVSTQNWIEVTGAALSGTGRFGWTTGEGYLFFSRGATGIFEWNGTTSTYAAISVSDGGQVPTAYHLAYFNDRLVALNVTDVNGTETNRIRWAATGLRRAWDHTAGTGAGFLDIWEGAAELLQGALILGNRLVVYREHSITDFYRTGVSSPIFGSEVRSMGIGTQAPYTIASTGLEHLFLGNDRNVWSWNGIKLSPVGDPIWGELEGLVDLEQFSDYYGTFSASLGEYWLVLPDSGNAFVFDVVRRTWARDSYPDIKVVAEIMNQTSASSWSSIDADLSSPTWTTIGSISWAGVGGVRAAVMLAGRSTGETFKVDSDVVYDYFTLSSLYEKYIETGDFYLSEDPAQDDNTLKRLILVYEYQPHPLGGTLSDFEVAASLDRGRNWITRQVTPVQAGYSLVDFNITGRVVRFRFKENSNARFRWTSYQFEFIPADPGS